MSKQIEALKLALEGAANYIDALGGDSRKYRQALAEDSSGTEQPAQQEPVAWMWKDGTVTTDPDRADGTWTPLYTSPPASKPWVGLTRDERMSIINGLIGQDLVYAFDAVEAKLREKNA